MRQSASAGEQQPPVMRRFARWGWFVVWSLVGAVAAIGFISLGPLALLIAMFAGVSLVTSSRARRSAWGLLSGAGLISLLIAYLQRDGPGTTCYRTATGGGGCDEHLDPRPWLIVGVVLVVLGVVAQSRTCRSGKNQSGVAAAGGDSA
jgi:hypothetical protein